MDGQGTKWRRKIAEYFNQLSRMHQRYRRQTDRRMAIAYSEHECELTFAKNGSRDPGHTTFKGDFLVICWAWHSLSVHKIWPL